VKQNAKQLTAKTIALKCGENIFSNRFTLNKSSMMLGAQLTKGEDRNISTIALYPPKSQ